MVTIMHFSAGTREQCEALNALEAEVEKTGEGVIVNAELFVGERSGHKFVIGDRCELVGLQEYPELNGKIVVITNYRRGTPAKLGYYIRSESVKWKSGSILCGSTGCSWYPLKLQPRLSKLAGYA